MYGVVLFTLKKDDSLWEEEKKKKIKMFTIVINGDFYSMCFSILGLSTYLWPRRVL